MKLYNTLNRQKEDFCPLEKDKVGIYCCGPTTYNYIHLGNARPLVVFDTIRRYFLFRGYKVNYVQNFTDIDDKIITRAKDENLSAEEIAEKYIAAYFEDTKELNILMPDTQPKVTEHIKEIIELVQNIITKGHAYVSGGDVYFDVRSFPEYGELSGRNIDDLKSGARISSGDEKKDPLDFALWKAAKPGEPAWDSPWGPGRPGWHIECSTMSLKYLGDTFDIHGGGADLIFPHHENEMAQSKAGTEGDFARYWMHNGFITVNEEKMSKSLGNFFLLRDVLAKFSGDVVRYYLLATHYRSPIDFSDDKLEVAKKSLERIRNSWYLLKDAEKKQITAEKDNQIIDTFNKLREDFIAAMDDDFNTALAFGVVFEFCHELNAYLQNNQDISAFVLESADKLFQDFDFVLGMIIPKEKEAAGLEDDLMNLILKIRKEARVKKDWATADAIRDGLNDLGIVVEDTPQGARWKKQ